MKPTAQGIEAITIRRSKVADADKVRYRVYRDATDFIAVIAESALMAVKVSGITHPYKIIRDLPTDGISIGAQRMLQEEVKEMVQFATKASQEIQQLKTEMAAATNTKSSQSFVPMGLSDMRQKKNNNGRILPPDLLYQIIEDHIRRAAGEPSPASPEGVPPILEAPPELSQAEKLTQMAEELLPPTAPEIAPAATEGPNLSPDEVTKLLNE